MNIMFRPEIVLDESHHNYDISLKELGGVHGYGDTYDKAVEMLLSKVENLAYAYFDDIESFLGSEEYNKQYDYYIKISQCPTKNDLLEVLGLVN